MAKINQKEYDILKGLDDKWKWIARDGGVFERVCVYSKPPKKGGVCWGTVSPIDEWQSLSMSNSFFQFIQWEDEKPYSIQELIDEYLDDEYGYFNMKLSREFEEFIKKSEETEVKKDIEWLKKWVEEYENKIIKELGDKFTDDFMTTRLHGGQSAVKEIKYRIDQLDEPEVLSQELPVIPKFVADYIQEGHELGVDLGTALTFETDHPNDIKKYIRDNEETFARAWLNGFTVEKEKRYEVILPAVTGAKDVYMVIDEDSSVYFESMDYIVRNACLKSEFTEQEIKDIDPRYMAFAVPVEEEEE